jgi:hypothetical protein
MSDIPSYNNVNMPSEKADLLDKIRPDNIIETFFHRFLGEEKINGQWVKYGTAQQRALTEVGAWDFTTLMLSSSTQNVSISNVNDRDIRTRTKSAVDTANLMSLRNWKEYGIKGSDQMHFIREIVITNTFFSMKQSEGGAIQKLIKDTDSTNRVIQENENKGGSILSKVGNVLRGR